MLVQLNQIKVLILKEFEENRFIPFLFILCVLKRPFGVPLYLNILPILVGFTYLLVARKISKVFYPLLAMYGIGLIVAIYYSDYKSIARLGQAICMIGVSMQVALWEKEKILFFIRSLLILFGSYYILEFFFPTGNYLREIGGLSLIRLQGPIGEVNYSAIIVCGLGLMALLFNKTNLLIASFVILLTSLSRTASLVLVIGSILFFFFRKFKNGTLVRYFNLFFFIVLASMPLTIFLISKFGSIELVRFLETVSSGRYFLYLPYVDMGIDNFFGMGYFRGWNNYHLYLEPHLDLANSIRGHQLNEQHSIFIQVFSEFGIAGYGLFLYFLNCLRKRVLIIHDQLSFTFLLLILLGYSFFNGLNEMILYVSIGIGLNLKLSKTVSSPVNHKSLK
jgi:hypothetical protein